MLAKYDAFWFICGSQHLYGPHALAEVHSHAHKIVENLNQMESIPFRIVNQPVVTTSEEIQQILTAANTDDSCVGVITWMHTFSPAKMWIAGLLEFRKPLLHFHTQFNRDIPWDDIDMDFMNLNQSAHGDREYGFISSRMGILRKVIVGHWQNDDVGKRIGGWMRTARAFQEGKSLKVARFGDNMRDVAVTEGNKVSAQIQFGWSINGYGMGNLVERINGVTDTEMDVLISEYSQLYELPAASQNPRAKASIREQARIELGIRSFLMDGNFTAFTTTFEDLHGVKQLPGLAVQHLMADGYGFGAEGDWKTAAFLRVMKVMAGFQGTSFMEDYTYHLEPGNEMILGAHMLEVCPTIAATRPRVEVHPLSIGGKADSARLIFDGKKGPAVVACLIDLGNRFRLIVNEVEAIQPERAMPRLPVARVLWKPQPSLSESAEAWIYAGGAHHTVFSYHVTTEQLIDFADMAGIECVVINQDTSLRVLRNELRFSDMSTR